MKQAVTLAVRFPAHAAVLPDNREDSIHCEDCSRLLQLVALRQYLMA